MNKPVSPEEITSASAPNEVSQPAAPKSKGRLRKRKSEEQNVSAEDQQATDTSTGNVETSSPDETSAPSSEAGANAEELQAAQAAEAGTQVSQVASAAAKATSLFGGGSVLPIVGGIAAAGGVAAAVGGGGSSRKSGAQSPPPPAPVVHVPSGGGKTATGTPNDPVIVNADGSVQISVQEGADWRYSTDGGQTWKPGTGSGIAASELTEGSNSVQIAQVDKNGQIGPITTINVVKDTTPPPAPVVQIHGADGEDGGNTGAATGSGTGTGADPGSTGGVKGTGTPDDPIVINNLGVINLDLEPDADWRFSVDGGKTWKPGSGTSIPGIDIDEGTDTIQIVQIDNAGNFSPVLTIDVLKDTAGPEAPVLDVSNSSTGTQSGRMIGTGTADDPLLINATGRVNIAAEPGDEWRYSTDGGRTWKPGSVKGITSVDLDEGINTIQIVQLDPVGNVSAPINVTVIKDTTAPGAPLLDVAHSSTGSQTGTVMGTGTAADPILISAAGKLTVTTEAGAAWSFSTDGGKSWKNAMATGITASDLVEGTNTVQIVQVDVAGNVSPSSTLTIVKDSTAARLSVTLSNVAGYDADGTPIVDRTAGGQLHFVNLEAGAKVQYFYVGMTSWVDLTTSADFDLNPADWGSGYHHIYFRQVDGLGNVSNQTESDFLYATYSSSAAIPNASVVVDVKTNAAGITVGSGTTSDPYYVATGGTIQIGHGTAAGFRFSTDGGKTWQQGSGSSIAVSSLAEGNNSLQIIQVDSAGNSSLASKITVVKDTSADQLQWQVNGILGIDGNHVPVFTSTQGQVVLTGLEQGARVEMFNAETGKWKDLGSNTVLQVSDLGMSAGYQGDLLFRQVDAVGNVSNTVEFLAWYMPNHIPANLTYCSSFNPWTPV